MHQQQTFKTSTIVQSQQTEISSIPKIKQYEYLTGFPSILKHYKYDSETTIELNNLREVSQPKLQISNLKNISYQHLENTKLRLKGQSYLMEMINHYIYEIADRNQAIYANYAHFLALLYLTLQEITITIHASINLTEAKKLIFSKLQCPNIKKQLSQSLYYDFMSFILRKQKITAQLIHSFMRRLMSEEREVCVSVFPYYFNMFAMVVNKEVIFNGEPQQNMIAYTFETSHSKFFNGNFTRQQVRSQMHKLQNLSIVKYHSEQL